MNFEAHLPENFSLLAQRQVYFVGIKGVGMASLAVLLQQAGLSVFGADTEESFVTDELLAQAGIIPDAFSEAEIPPGTDCVFYSGAHRGSANPLVQAAINEDIPVFSQAQALGLLSRAKSTIAVCGVGGKSTTSALLASIFTQALRQPSFSVGVGTIPNLGTSGLWERDGENFFVEADEYVADPLADQTPRFLYLSPHHIICTSLSFDHPDVYGSFSDTQRAFLTFFAKRPSDGWLVYNGDDQALRTLVTRIQRTISVGEGENNDVRLTHFQVHNGVGQVTLEAPGHALDGVKLASIVPGRHNLLNAAYAAVLASYMGIDTESILHAVGGFRSTPRRFEFKGQTVNGTLCYDDYAHHPREILAVAQTLQEWFPEKIPVIVFQPHTYSRTKALLNEFVEALAFTGSPVLLLPIFASAREAIDTSVSSRDIELALEDKGVTTAIIPDQETLAKTLETYDDRHVFITLGAGDIYKVYDYVQFV